ncbi:MAG: magnesium/cobalt transporter CorA [Candidatus Krumholzibacteriia bacterium]
MAKLYRKVTRKPAQPPGTVEFTGLKKTDDVVITVIDYKDGAFEERRVADVAACLPFRDSDSTTWINIDGLHDIESLKVLSDHFGIHPLVQEDIVNTHQRPKVEDYDAYLFIVIHMLSATVGPFDIHSEQISLLLGPDFVISFQEKPGDVFEPVRERLRVGKGRIRGWGADYLAYALLDAVVDHYFTILEKAGELIEFLEEELLEKPDPTHLQLVHHYKREMILMRRAVWPLREVVGYLERAESELIQDRVSPFLRDVYDHTVQVAESVETFRDMLSGLQDLYLSSISNKMNEVMKVLTIAATIFVPLTFFAGIYGMNFEHMPELGWKWSYPVFWVFIILCAGGMLAFFRRRKYL